MISLLGLFGVYVMMLFWTLVLSKVISFFRGGSTGLVVQKLAIRTARSSQTTNAVEITGRREGLVAFLLTLAGLSPTTSLVVNDREAVCRTTGLLGIENRSIPMDRVAQVTSGSTVAFEYIVGAIAVLVVGLAAAVGFLWKFDLVPLVGTPVVTAVAMVAMGALYLLNKRFFVGVFPQAGPSMILAFKPNVIEGVELNLERAMEIAAIIRSSALKNAGVELLAAPVPAQPIIAQPDMAEVAILAPPATAMPEEAEPPVEEIAGPHELMQRAKELLKSAQPRDAFPVLQQLVMLFPGSNEAKQARKFLERSRVNS